MTRDTKRHHLTSWHLTPINRSLLALLAGMVAVTGWAPLAWWPMLALVYGALFWLVDSRPGVLPAGITGLLFGLGLHVTGHGWIYTTMTDQVAMDNVAALFVSGLVWVGLALFTATPCVLYSFILRNLPWTPAIGLARTGLFASLMTLGEITRALAFERFSSLSLGYGLIDTWLAGMAPVIGNYGLSWLLRTLRSHQPDHQTRHQCAG